MVSSNDTSLQWQANYVNWIGMMFIRCFCSLMIPLGIVGHTLSIFVFTRRALRTNSCAIYLLAASVFGLLGACFILPMRLIQSGYIGIDPTAHSRFLCKIVWFLLYSIRSLCFWFVVLACVDRYLCSSSSAKIRAWSSTRMAFRTVPITILVGFVVYIHIPLNFNIYILPTTHKPVCHSGGPPGLYRKLLSLFNLIVFGLVPPLCMLISGIFTLRCTHRRQRFHTVPVTRPKLPKTKTSEGQLLRMLLTQVFIYSVSGMLFSIAFIIIAMNTKVLKTELEIAQENLIIAVVGMLSNTGPCLSFYLYTLSSRLFRKELKNFFKELVETKGSTAVDYMTMVRMESTTQELPVSL